MVQLCQNHWKTIDRNGGLKKNINHSIALENWPSLWSKPEDNQSYEIDIQNSFDIVIFCGLSIILKLTTWLMTFLE